MTRQEGFEYIKCGVQCCMPKSVIDEIKQEHMAERKRRARRLDDFRRYLEMKIETCYYD